MPFPHQREDVVVRIQYWIERGMKRPEILKAIGRAFPEIKYRERTHFIRQAREAIQIGGAMRAATDSTRLAELMGLPRHSRRLVTVVHRVYGVWSNRTEEWREVRIRQQARTTVGFSRMQFEAQLQEWAQTRYLQEVLELNPFHQILME